MRVKPFGQLKQPVLRVVVTDGAAGRLPHVLLRIEVRGCRGKDKDLQARVGRLHRLNRRATMPWCPVPQQHNRHIWIGCQDRAQVRCRRFSMHGRCLRHEFASGFEVEGPIEICLRTARVTPHGERLPTWCPHCHRRRLQIQRGFVQRQHDGVGRILCRVNQVFSICAAKSITAAWLRDVNILVGR